MQSKLFCILLVFLCVGPAAFGADAQRPDPELSPFSGAIADAVWTIIAFVVLLVVLWKLAWKPILVALNARQEHIEKQITDAEHTRKEAERILAEYNKKLENAESQGETIIAAHLDKAERQAKEIIDGAKDKADEMIQKAYADIEKAGNQAGAQFLEKAGELVLRLGQEILGRNIDDRDNQKMIQEAVERLKQQQSKKD